MVSRTGSAPAGPNPPGKRASKILPVRTSEYPKKRGAATGRWQEGDRMAAIAPDPGLLTPRNRPDVGRDSIAAVKWHRLFVNERCARTCASGLEVGAKRPLLKRPGLAVPGRFADQPNMRAVRLCAPLCYPASDPLASMHTPLLACITPNELRTGDVAGPCMAQLRLVGGLRRPQVMSCVVRGIPTQLQALNSTV